MDGPRLYGVGFKSLSCACFSHALRVPCCAENQGRGKSVRCMLVILPLLLLRLRTRDKHDDTAAILTMATTRTTATTMTRSKSHTANLSRNVVPGELLKVAKTKPGVGSWPHFVQGPPPPHKEPFEQHLAIRPGAANTQQLPKRCQHWILKVRYPVFPRLSVMSASEGGRSGTGTVNRRLCSKASNTLTPKPPKPAQSHPNPLS